MIFAHASLGIIVAWIIISLQKSSKKKLPRFNEMLIWVAGAIGGIFPDLDLLYIFFVDSSISHRVLISHSLIPYLIFAAGASLVFKLLTSSKKDYLILITFLAGVLSHLLSDMIIGPVYFLKPIINTVFIWEPYYIPEGASILDYFLSPYMMMEIVIIILSLILLILSLDIRKKEFKIILYLLCTIQLGAWIALLPFL